MGHILICVQLLLQAFSIQTDWTGGPGVVGPVTDFGSSFLRSDSVSYSLSGLIIPTTQMSGNGVITSWTEHVIEDNGHIDGHNAIRPVDLDGDGDYDLAGVISGLDIVRIYRNQLIETGGSAVSFAQQVDLPTRVSKYCMTWVGDLNNDGRKDIVVPGDSLFWFRNNGNWSFTRTFIGYKDHRGDTNFCDVGDIDNDGDLDIVCGMKPLLLWRNNGDMTFARESISGGRRYRAKFGDLNGDGYLDLLQTDDVYINGGAAHPGVFPHTPDWTTGFPAGQSDGSWIADFDGDNDRDILVCREWVYPRSLCAIIWYENDGTGRDFTRHNIATGETAFDYADAAIAEDMDIDGRTDVVGGYQMIGYFHQDPPPSPDTFTEVVVDPNFGGPGGCHWVEVQNLGKQPGGIKFTKDIIASGGDMFHWWENGLDTSFSINGQLTSSILDAGGPADWEWLVWEASRPESTYLDFYVRTGVSAAQCTLNVWQGPISVAVGADVDSVQLGPFTTPDDRYFQYRVAMAGDSSGVLHRAPVVYEVRVVFDSDQAVHDVGVTSVLAPAGTLGLGAVVTPRAVVRNHGTAEETFPVTLRVGALYDETMPDVTLAPGGVDTVNFPEWTADPLGTHPVMAFTDLAGDEERSNDTAAAQVVVVEPRHDVGATRILVPTGKVLLHEAVKPSIRVENFGHFEETFDLEVLIKDASQAVVFQECEEVTALAAGERRDVTFAEHLWNAEPEGNYIVRARTMLPGDCEPANDEQGPEQLLVLDAPPGPPGWSEMVSMPMGPADRPVKSGGWLAIDPASRFIYAAKGNKTYEFYRFDVWANSWTRLADIEPGVFKVKPPDKGSRGVCDGNGSLYMTKGNNTLEFWQYDIARDTWLALPDVPEGQYRKPVKGGTDMVYAVKEDVGYIYLMKGYKTEFYRFNTVTRAWDTLPELPYGGRAKWDKGSFLVYDDAGHIYAHQAKYYDRSTEHHYMFRYDVAGDTWEREGLPGMSVLGLHAGRIRRKKSKDGAGGAWFDGEIYALKGGNSQQFHKFTSADNTWSEQDSMPTFGTSHRRKFVKYGGDIVSYGVGAFYALKGNKTRELWRYKAAISVGPAPRRGAAVMGDRTGPGQPDFQVGPNPLVEGVATVRYELAEPGLVSLTVRDVCGRNVGSRTLAAGRSGSVSLDVRDLASGVYLVRLAGPGGVATRQLVVR